MIFPSTASTSTGRFLRTALATNAALFLGACAQLNSPSGSASLDNAIMSDVNLLAVPVGGSALTFALH